MLIFPTRWKVVVMTPHQFLIHSFFLFFCLLTLSYRDLKPENILLDSQVHLLLWYYFYISGHCCSICSDFSVSHCPCLRSGPCGAYRFRPVQRRCWARGNYLDILWDSRGKELQFSLEEMLIYNSVLQFVWFFHFRVVPTYLQYLAPEVLRKEPYDRTVDWWCLGAVLYEMIYSLVRLFFTTSLSS